MRRVGLGEGEPHATGRPQHDVALEPGYCRLTVPLLRGLCSLSSHAPPLCVEGAVGGSEGSTKSHRPPEGRGRG